MKHLQQLIYCSHIFFIILLFWASYAFTQTQTFMTSHNLQREGLQFSHHSGRFGGMLIIKVQGQHPYLYIDIFTRTRGQYLQINPIMTNPIREDHYDSRQIVTGHNILFYLREMKAYSIDIYTQSEIPRNQPILITVSWNPLHPVKRSETEEKSILDRLLSLW